MTSTNIVITSPVDLFKYLESEWEIIARSLTAAFSPSLKNQLKEKLSSELPAIEAKIAACAESGQGAEANQWRHAHEFITSITSELSMWLALSKNRVDSAWSFFCDAESSAIRVAHWLPEYDLARKRISHLAELERIVFPHQEWFFSTGMIVSKEICTICDSEYGTCGHLALELYNGKMAARHVIPQEILEISFVNHPSDKRCRMVSVGGVDPLTGEPSKTRPVQRQLQSATSVQRAPRRRRKKRR